MESSEIQTRDMTYDDINNKNNDPSAIVVKCKYIHLIISCILLLQIRGSFGASMVILA